MSYSQRTLATPTPSPGVAVEWEEVGCLLCGGQRRSSLVAAQDPAPGPDGLWFAVVQCQDCGLCYTNPRPSEPSVVRFYGPKRTRPTRAAPALFDRWPWLRDRFRPHSSPGRLLDFGGGVSFRERMRRGGWSVTGADLSAAGRIRPDLAAGYFDAVTMRHTLEHAHQPLEVLAEAHRLLADGGRLRIVVPNIDSMAYRWFQPGWIGLDLPRHLTHFTPSTLALMLERANFRVGPVRMLRHSRWLRQSARRATDRRRPYWHRWLATRPGARLAAWYAALTCQADCLVATACK